MLLARRLRRVGESLCASFVPSMLVTAQERMQLLVAGEDANKREKRVQTSCRQSASHQAILATASRSPGVEHAAAGQENAQREIAFRKETIIGLIVAYESPLLVCLICSSPIEDDSISILSAPKYVTNVRHRHETNETLSVPRTSCTKEG